MDFLNETLEGVEGKEDIIAKIKQEVAKNYIPKEEFNKKNEELKTTKELLETRDQQLDELKEKAEGNEELVAKLDELKELNEKTKAEYEGKLGEINKDITITKRIAESELKFHDIDLVKTLVDYDQVSINDDGINGLKEQLEKIAEDKPFLLKQEDKPNISTGSPKAGSDNSQGGWKYSDLIKNM